MQKTKKNISKRSVWAGDFNGMFSPSIKNSQCEFTKTAIEALPYPFYVIDAKTYSVVLANSAADFGDLSENKKCFELTHNKKGPCGTRNHPCSIKLVEKTGEPVVVEHIHLDKKGEARYVEVYAYPIIKKGKVVQIIEYVIDITERKNSEKELHDLNNELENKVRERTKELENTNRLLKEKIKAHQQTEKKMLKLYRHLGVTNRRISILLGLNRNNGSLGADQAIKNIVESAASLSNAKVCAFYRFDAKTKNFSLLFTNSAIESEGAKRIFSAVSNKLLQTMAKKKKRIIGSAEDYDLGELNIKEKHKHILMLPLLMGGQMKAVLLLCFGNGQEVTTQDLDLYDAYAMQASLVLQELDIMSGT